MKAFLVGLLFLFAVLILLGIGIVLYPFLLIGSFFLQFIIGFIFIIFAIWLLGKFILYIWDKFKK
ncbi:MAG: hypothetical protein AB1755_05945 [Candidatus Omnitrophota bacterium]